MMISKILKQYFGYDAFRQGQEEIVKAIAAGRDAFGVMPTGAGKSICYQVPAIALSGVTIVISPLISLMRDQVMALSSNGIPSAFINSSLSPDEYSFVMSNAKKGKYKLIYVAPERLLTPSMQYLANIMPISLIAVDEAHCISLWGQDFRPSYLDIPKFISSFKARPIVAAFTATATPRVRQDILDNLGLNKPLVITTSFDRPNLSFGVSEPKDKYSALIKFLVDNDGCGIVYCSTRKEVDSVASRLQNDGYRASGYHAGLPEDERAQAQDDFIYDRIQVIVATNAFGMGIDKPNARFVIHYNMPQNLESYYQEAGRAGRDGLPGSCMLFYARKDVKIALYLIDQSENEDEKIRNRALLNQMVQYCETGSCLRRFILEYFGETYNKDCQNCSSCNEGHEGEDSEDGESMLLRCLESMNKGYKKYGIGAISKVLLGIRDDYVTERGFDKLPSFGAMSWGSYRDISRIFDKLVSEGYISLSSDQYRTASITAKAKGFSKGKEAYQMRMDETQAKPRRANSSVNSLSNMLSKLKALRKEVAAESNTPLYVIFSDATLIDMCKKHPRTKEEFLNVSGVGKIKLERYGERFLSALNEDMANDF